MAIELERPTLSFEEFMALQDRQERAVRGYEYEDGKLIPVSPVTGPQSSAWTKLTIQLGHHVTEGSLGEIWLDLLVYLDPRGRRRYFPDLVYLDNDSLHRFDGTKIVGPPTLVVEVSVDSSRERDRDTKMKAYHKAAVPWFWIVDVVTREIDEYRWAPEGYELVSRTPFDSTFTPQLFPGLSLSGIGGRVASH